MAAFGLRVFLGGLQQESYCWGKVICFRLYFPLWWAQAHWVCFGAPRAPPLRAGAQQQIKVHLKSPGRQLPDQVREPPRPCPGAPRGCTEHCRVQASQPGKDQISVPHRSSSLRQRLLAGGHHLYDHHGVRMVSQDVETTRGQVQPGRPRETSTTASWTDSEPGKPRAPSRRRLQEAPNHPTSGSVCHSFMSSLQLAQRHTINQRTLFKLVSERCSTITCRTRGIPSTTPLQVHAVSARPT